MVCTVAVGTVGTIKNEYQDVATASKTQPNNTKSLLFGINHEEIASKLLRRLKSKEDAVIEFIEGYQMTDSQKYRMRLVRVHMDYITAEINDVDSEIESIISSDPDYENAIRFLMTIPGVKRDSAMRSCSRQIRKVSLLQKEI